MLKKIVLCIVLVVSVNLPIGSFVAYATSLARPLVTQITDVNTFFRFNNVSAMATYDDSLVVADYANDTTEVLQFDIDSLDPAKHTEHTLIATLDYRVNQIGLLESSTLTQLYTLQNRTFRVYDIIDQNTLDIIYQRSNIASFVISGDNIRLLYVPNSGNPQLLQYNTAFDAPVSVTMTGANNPTSFVVASMGFYIVHNSGVVAFVNNSGSVVNMTSPLPNTQQLYLVDDRLLIVSNDHVAYMSINEAQAPTALIQHSTIHSSASNQSDLMLIDHNQTLWSVDLDFQHPLTSLLASRDNLDNFYANPQDIFARSGHVYIADRNNDRLTIHSQGRIQQISLRQPLSVVSTRSNEVYVLQNIVAPNIPYSSRISIVNTELNAPEALSRLEINTPTILNGLQIDALDNIYAWSSTQLFVLNSNRLVDTQLNLGTIISIARYIDDRGILVAHRQNNSYQLSRVTQNNNDAFVATSLVDPLDIRPASVAIDYNHNIFVANSLNGIARITRIATQEDIPPQTFELPSNISDNVHISIATHNVATTASQGDGSTASIYAGDLLLIDSQSHLFVAINGTKLGVELFDPTEHDSVNLLTSTPPVNIIQTVLPYTRLYRYPSEMSDNQTITENLRLIVVQQTFDEHPLYSRVLLDRPGLIFGYVLHTSLQQIDFSPPTYRQAQLVRNAPIFRFPTVASPRLNGGNNILLGTTVTILDFVPNFINNIDVHRLGWLRIYHDEQIGYMHQRHLVSSDTVLPNLTVMPRTNASVRGENVFVSTIDNLEPFASVMLARGTRVAVIGTFNPSSTYTRVHFLDNHQQPRVAYIRTTNLLYDNVTQMQMISIVIAIIFALTTVVLIIAYKKRRLKHVQTQYTNK